MPTHINPSYNTLLLYKTDLGNQSFVHKVEHNFELFIRKDDFECSPFILSIINMSISITIIHCTQCKKFRSSQEGITKMTGALDRQIYILTLLPFALLDVTQFNSVTQMSFS